MNSEQIERRIAALKTFVSQHTFESALEGWKPEARALLSEADWQQFVEQVEALTPATVSMDTRPVSSVGFIASITPALGAWNSWAGSLISARTKAAEDAWIASTVRVLHRQNGKLKESRVLPADLPKWQRDGLVIVEHATIKSSPVRQDNGRDNLSFFAGGVKVVAYRNGDELEFGTVKEMRVVGRKTQYLVKPRSKAAEARYRAALEEVARLDRESTTASIDESYYRAKELREQIAQVKRAAHIPERIATVEVVDYDALHAEQEGK